MMGCGGRRALRALTVGVCLLALAACATVRETAPLSYPGDGRQTVPSLEAEIGKRGFKPICKDEAYCKFEYKPGVWIHYKTSEKRAVMVVDVKDGKEMPAAELQSAQQDADAFGRELWQAASADAQQRAQAQARAEADAARREEEEERREAERAEKDGDSGGGVLGVLNGISDAMGKVQVNGGTNSRSSSSGGGNGPARCCINRQYYACSSAAALDDCAGKFGRCMMKCMNSSDSNCPDNCLRDSPPNPSGCSREPANDGQCR